MTTAATTEEGIFSPNWRGTTIAVMAAVGIVAYNNLAVSAALPEVGNDLGDVALLPWTISVELLTSGVAMLAAGPLIDSIGARRIFRVGAMGFIVTSILCAAAPSMLALVGARALQGLFAGLVMTVVLSAIGILYPAQTRARVFAANSTVWGVTSVAGPTAAAGLVATVGWQGVFLINVPVALIAAYLAWNKMPTAGEQAERTRIDGRGIALVTVITASALATAQGSLVLVGVGLAVTLVSAALYLPHERRAPHPVVRIAHIVSSKFRAVHLTSAIVVGTALGIHAFLPVYLRGARGLSSAAAAFSIVWMSTAWSVSAFIAGKLQRRFGPEPIILGAVIHATCGLTAVALSVATEAPIWMLFASLFWTGSGIGCVSVTGVVTLQSRVELSEMGRINAVHQFLRTVGITYGVGLAGVIIFTTVDHRAGDVEAVRDLPGGEAAAINQPVAVALAAGYTYTVFAGLIAMGLAITSALALVRGRVKPVPSAA
jgi:MFS family permease